jgi:hypothetical protein
MFSFWALSEIIFDGMTLMWMSRISILGATVPLYHYGITLVTGVEFFSCNIIDLILMPLGPFTIFNIITSVQTVPFLRKGGSIACDVNIQNFKKCWSMLKTILDTMFQERRVAAIVRSTYEIDRGTQVIFLCRRNLAIDIKWPIFCDWNKTQSPGAVNEEMVW